MNWYVNLVKLSFIIKVADPHVSIVCPHCGKEFFMDLLWENPEEARTYHALDDAGHFLRPQEVAQSPKAHRIVEEWSQEEIECPACQHVWSATFVRKPKESNVPKEVAKELPSPLGLHHPTVYPD